MSNIPRSSSNGSSAPPANNQQGHPNLLPAGAAPARGQLDPRLLQRMAMQNPAVASHIATQQVHQHPHQHHHQGQRGQRGGPPPQARSPQHLRPAPQPQQQQQSRLTGMLGGGTEALRTLALMKSLGVSPGATALAAAVLPNTALPKTAAAVTAAAAAKMGGLGLGATTPSTMSPRAAPPALGAASYRHQQLGGMVPNPLRPQGGAVAARASAGGNGGAPPSVGQTSASSSPNKQLTNERNNRSNMLRTYGEENPLFYERLVQLVGKKDADEMVREAVDETIKEEVEGNGGKEAVEAEPAKYREQDVISIADTSEEEEEDEKKKQPASQRPVNVTQKSPGTKVTTARAPAPPMAQVTVPKVVVANNPQVATARVAQTKARAAPVQAAQAAPAQAAQAAPFSPLYNSATTAQESKKRKADGLMPPANKLVAAGSAGSKRPKKYSHALPIPPSGPANDKMLRTLLGRPPGATSTPGLAKGNASGQGAAGKDEEPPGFDQFKADPKFCVLLFECAKEWKKKMAAKKSKSIGGLFVHGLLNIKDDELLNSLDDSDPSIRAYVKDVITPYLNVPSNLTESDGQWEAYIHISSDNINEFAKTIVYQRRKAMKSAVKFALYEIGKNRPSLLEGGGKQKSESQSAKIEVKKKETEKDKRVKELEEQLASEKEKHAKEIKALEDQHFNETKECEHEYTEFVSKLLKSHRKEMNELKRSMKDMQSVHKTFFDSYVEASLDIMRDSSESREPKL
eukprot:CAMPEP_0172547550 /NCGR_PEP_ID=MMETSP1067-20121228/17053_1 /TAXON_ID=265564 ORGANISM="Thalassiosira punctigera, Strain Tpunct2005C2" /NCGR_SAMPLE_ID=MMETSP1067 /ASSEMBLY_ACC=CAM_ASM_000444 /LENGTH=742 /DNA_ID=CAMNT_0013334649 /DNA_START=27 /DNA_END=2255 /DNA_ORIENTATION=+